MTNGRRQTQLIAYRAFSDLAGKAALFIVTLVAARRLSQDEFGVFGLGTTAGWIAAVATDFGIQLHVAREVAQAPARALSILRTWFRVRLWTSAAAIFAVSAALVFVKVSANTAQAIFLFTVVYVVNGLVEFLHYYYRGLSRSDIESTLTLVQRATLLILALAVLWLSPGVTKLALAMLAPAVATLLISWWQATRLASAAPLSAADSVSLSFADTALVVPIGAGIVLSALYFRVDVFLVERWAGTAAVALYNAVFRLVEALRLFPAAVLAVTLPVLFQATSRRPLITLAGWLVAGSIAATVILWIAASWLIPFLYGERYRTAVPAFRVLVLAFPLMSLNYALTHQLIGWHGHRAYAYLCASALVFNVILNARLIPAAGIVGASWSTLATEAVVTIGCLLALARTPAHGPAFGSVANPAVPS